MRFRLALVTLTAAAAAAAGCADSSPILLASVRPVQPVNGYCAPAAALLSSSTVDVALGTGVTLGLEVVNLMAANGDKTNGRTDTTQVFIDTVRTKFRLLSGSPAPAPLAVPAFGVLRPGATLLVAADVLPEAAGADLASLESDTLIATISVEGHTGEGGRVESAEIDFPITVCRDCIKFPGCETVASCGSAGDAASLSCAD